ncbi:class III lanthionine synthetase LanKC [Rhodococcus erythropolis]|uniref:class III lanthionine synthetase LanKC n=1 Tax=Rhodococcus erythropolis TaxID=1833 RepID=UPI0018A2BDE9|nr:class III lanthionine synthetase LanKC [Rhodococcus erythropolis]MBF7733304.1 class III lanthionine synthetase LanKC [Rhodococcus erythropolis]MCZ4641964.1 class III lanthionine synthetase LanKC [Rhodococcus erythropolis]
MDLRYVAFTRADSHFYDRIRTVTRPDAPTDQHFKPAKSVDWSLWRRGPQSGPWNYFQPPDSVLPEQGWKIHCSATQANAQDLLDTVSAYCGHNLVPFKFLRTAADLMFSNSKQANRTSSGKFITIYPADSVATQRVITELDELVTAADGPYILSDVRWNRGPLYLRYGAYLPMHTNDSFGDRVPAIRRPDGSLEPDLRGTSFRTPDWVQIPDFVCAQQDKLKSRDAFPYSITEALHFSNSGGIYSALDDAGINLVIKEGRPFTAPDANGRYAIDRIRNEYDTLTHLADNPYSPSALNLFEREGHHFLVTERAPGAPLNQEIALRYPLIRADQTLSSRTEYRTWALDIAQQLTTAVESFHYAGIVHADLHPGNVMCSPSGIRIIDFEMAHSIDEQPPRSTGAPGYTAPQQLTGIEADRYSLGCIELGLFVPLTTLLPLDRNKIPELIGYAVSRFDLPRAFCASLYSMLDAQPPEPEDHPHRWDTSSRETLQRMDARLRCGILTTLDLSRADRLFPGDIAQFEVNGYGIAHGSCGNLLADDLPTDTLETVLEWTEHQVDSDTQPRFGFFDGLAGAVHTFRQLGRHSTADRWVETLRRAPLDALDSSLFGGLSGIGCLLLEESESCPAASSTLALVTETLRDRLPAARAHVRFTDGTSWATTGRGGLMRGPSGQALFWTRHYERTGDPRSLEHARQLVDIDLSVMQMCPDGSMQLTEERRTMPYLGSGSVGVGLVLLQLVRHVDEPRYASALLAISRAAAVEFTAQAGLLNGRAGLILFLGELSKSPYAGADCEQTLAQQFQLLGLHSLNHAGGLHFPGEQNLRLSTDWATGSAGILASLRHTGSATARQSFPLMCASNCHIA